MKVWHFSEMAYHPGWEAAGESMRVEIPSRIYDPEVGAELYNRFLDEWAMCDELGLNIMINEHHATATCTTSACSIPLAILARQTKKARLLALGMPIANRSEPVRIAEEYAMIDVISRGRVEMGFVKGSPYELSPSNSNPASLMERFWEAHDLIMKALTTTEGPFNWEGTHFQYRQVNVWPRPFQQPHPPVWMTGGSPGSARSIADKRYVFATLNTGFRTRPLFDAYREQAAAQGWEAGPDRFAYLGLVGVGETKEEGFRRADQIMDYIRTNPYVRPQYTNPPGYAPAAGVAKALRQGTRGPVGASYSLVTRDGRKLDKRSISVEDCIEAGMLFAGTPDMVYEQICDFHEHTGGLGHLLMMGQGGWLSHKDTVANLSLFSREVLPRLEELN